MNRRTDIRTAGLTHGRPAERTTQKEADRCINKITFQENSTLCSQYMSIFLEIILY